MSNSNGHENISFQMDSLSLSEFFTSEHKKDHYKWSLNVLCKGSSGFAGLKFLVQIGPDVVSATSGDDASWNDATRLA